jgi:DNA-binding MarR family transcriptional regulator
MAESSDSNYFGSFLESVNKSSSTESDPNAAPLKLLQLLQERGPQRTSELQNALHVDLLAFSKSLDAMTKANLVQISGEPGEEVISLTEQGHTLASLQAATA